MSTTISEHQARVYEYAKAKGGQWFTTMELSIDTNIPANSAKSHAARFEEIGIFERIRISPAHAFRLDADAHKHAPKMIARLEEAMQIFASRRMDWLRREQTAVQRLDMDRGSPATRAIAEPQERQLVEPTSASSAPTPRLSAVVERPANVATPILALKPSPPDPQSRGIDRRAKVEVLFSMIARPEGASLDELASMLGNQPHSVRATISVKSRERGINVTCVDGRYFLAG